MAGLVAVGYPAALGYLQGLFFAFVQAFDVAAVSIVQDFVCCLIFCGGADVHFSLGLGIFAIWLCAGGGYGQWA